ncbi:MAG: SdiA-regulated domain-containing protein [Aquaticitalea sp.]
MKLSKTLITVTICITLGIAILAMQQPVTKALVGQSINTEMKISKTWDLPQELNEISGIAWLHENTFACVQDEDGIIFIYDLDQNKITDQIDFAGPGDYEGIAIDGENAYVMRSDGYIYSIQDFRTDNKKITELQTDFSEDNNIESLTFDATHKRLLTTPKDKDLINDNFKGIYQIPLDKKLMEMTPIAKINMNEKAFESFKNKKLHKTFNPSDIAVNPMTDQLYVVEGKNPKFIVMDRSGKLIRVIPLDEKTFPQPEGISFSSDGRLFISNEANDGSATIVEINLN